MFCLKDIRAEMKNKIYKTGSKDKNKISKKIREKNDDLAIGNLKRPGLTGKEKIRLVLTLVLWLASAIEGSDGKEVRPDSSRAFFSPVAKISSSSILRTRIRPENNLEKASAGIKFSGSASSLTEKIDDLLRREKITVALIDSGLGGLSLMAEAASRLEKIKFYREVNLVFFNALFSTEGGYNALPTREARLEMFDRVLTSLEKKIQPDLILIACNTLSTLYPSTQFARKARIPVLNIVKPGVDLLRKKLEEEPLSVAIIFATPITISEDTHRQLLLKEGFTANRFITQACPELEIFIEKDPEGEETALLISAFLTEALARIPEPWPPVILSLNCTHYGYSLALWERAARENNLPFIIINPNSSLIDLWLKPDARPRFPRTAIKAICLSRVPIEEKRKQALASFLRKISHLVAEALLNYKFDPGLF